jgi:hypothetical protein
MAGRESSWWSAAGAGTSQTAPGPRPPARREREESRKLSRAAVETLAIIAYHEPVSRAEIEAIRGVQIARGTLDVLLEAGWVRPAGRREAPGGRSPSRRPQPFCRTSALAAGATCRASRTSRPRACSTRSTWRGSVRKLGAGSAGKARTA